MNFSKLTVPHECHKADIAVLGGHKGKTNSTTYRAGDISHPARALVFIGFVGQLDVASGKYRGVLRFAPAAPEEGADVATLDFAELHKPSAAPAPKPKSPAATGRTSSSSAKPVSAASSRTATQSARPSSSQAESTKPESTKGD